MGISELAEYRATAFIYTAIYTAMAKFFCLLFFVILCQSGFAQDSKIDSVVANSNLPTYSKFNFLSECVKLAKDLAEKDIKKDSIFIFLVGGIGPVKYTSDKAFEQKFNVRFHD